MAKRDRFDYYDAFEKQAGVACELADTLIEVIETFTTAEALEPMLHKAHVVESKGDAIAHKIYENVAIDFITPIDREDIIHLTQRLDNISDMLESVIQYFYMYDVHHMHPEAIVVAKMLKESTEALKDVLADFRNFKKSESFRDLLMRVNDYEEEADMVYMQTIRKLYTEDRDKAVRVEVWSRIFQRMEHACDACEAVADTLSSIILKNM